MHQRTLGFLASIALIAASCQSPSPSQAPPATIEPDASARASAAQPSTAPVSDLAPEQILRVSIAEPLSLDPTGLGAPDILRALQRPLVDFGQDNKVVPALAERWDISDGGKRLTFHLREARYSNGEPIVAGDFVYSARRLADPRTAAYYAYVMGRVVGGPDLLDMAKAKPVPSDADIEAALDNLGVSAPDHRTFVVQLRQPATYFLSALTLYVFVPLQEKWITSPKATEPGNFVSSGPFILDRWDHNSLIVLRPNPHWWGDVKPTLTEIQMTISNPARALLAYEAGELDLAMVPSADVKATRADSDLAAEYRETPQLAVNAYSFNNFQDPGMASYAEPGPTVNKDFRIALTQAIDKQALIDVTWAGLGQVANSFVMPGIPGYQPELNPYPYDVDAGRQHMAKALDALGVGSVADLKKLKLGYISGRDNEPVVAFMAEAWRQAFGLEVEQIGSERSSFFNDRSLGHYDIAFDGWGADFPHAVNQLDGVFTCPASVSMGHYCNPSFDAILAMAAAEPDQDMQVAIYEDAQTLLMNDAPILPLQFPVSPFVVKPYVSRLTAMPSDSQLGDYYYETIQILKH